MKTNVRDREILKPLLRGLDHLYAGIKQSNKTNEEYGIRLVEKWITENHEYFVELWKEIE